MKKTKPSPKDVFFQAIQLDSAEDLNAYLKTACGVDESLRAQVEELLAAHQKAGRFLGDYDSSIQTSVDSSGSELSGTQIGPYKLLEIIGEGGMGVVFLAEQDEPVQRQVALKLIKPGMDTRQVIARFAAEEQSLAMMDHPGIAKVFDAGATESGRPYFVMELIHGIPIHKFCDQQRLDTKQRLKLFIEVCHAVQHAHQKGIIHRDLKPSNILVAMVDDQPAPKIIDFGVAKATGPDRMDKTTLTRIDQVIGTLEYMSPEQTRSEQLDIDTRADIYALGAILYELLTGTPPFEIERMKKQAFDETLRMIREEEPTRPSTKLGSSVDLAKIAQHRHTPPHRLSALVHGDLDWIVMKALEKDRARRYPSASAFAADIERFLKNETVEACPPSRAYRFKKFATRNKPAMVVAALTSLFLLAGAIGLGVSNYLLREREKETQAALRKAEENFALAKKNEEQARFDAATAVAANDFINLLLGRADPHEEPDRDLKVSAVLDRALQSIEGRFTEQPLVEAEVRERIAKALENLGRTDEAEQQLTAAHQIYEREFGPHDRRTLSIEGALLWNGHEHDNYQQCLEKYEELLGLLIDRFGSDDPLTLKTAAQRADLNRHLGRYRESELQFREVLAAQERVLGPDHKETLVTIGNMAMTIVAAGRYGEAEELFARLVEHSARAVGPEHPMTLHHKTNLADAVLKQNRFAEAEELYREILSIQRRVLGLAHPTTLGSMGHLAGAIRQAGRLNECLPMYEQLLELKKSKFGKDHYDTVTSMNELALAYLDAGDLEKAVTLLEQTLEKRKNQLGEDHPESLTSMGNLGYAYYQTRQFEKAISLLEQTLALWKSKRSEDHLDTTTIMNNLALAYQGAEQLDKALPLFEKSLDQKKSLLGPDDPKTLNTMSNLASAYMDAGEFAKGIQLMEQTVEVFKAKLGEDHPITLNKMGHLAHHYWLMGQLDKSIPLFEEVLQGREAQFGPNHRYTQLTVSNLGTNYKDAGRLDEAIPLLEQGYQAIKDDPFNWKMGVPLVDAYVKNGETDKAEAVAKELMEKIRRLPQDSPMCARLFASLAGSYFLPVEAWSDAESLMRESLAIFEAEMPDKWQTFNTRSLLGRALMGQNKYAEAESYLLDGYQGLAERRKLIAPISEILTESLEALVQLYESWHMIQPDAGHDSQAEQWRRQLQNHTEAKTENETK